MDSMLVPEGYQTVMPYLILNGAVSFFDFTRTVFGAVEKMRHGLEDGSILHGEVRIGDSTIMFSNASPQWPVQNAGLYVHVDDVDFTFEKALDAGAVVVAPVTDQPYGRSGGVKDPFGNVWWITTPPKI